MKVRNPAIDNRELVIFPCNAGIFVGFKCKTHISLKAKKLMNWGVGVHDLLNVGLRTFSFWMSWIENSPVMGYYGCSFFLTQPATLLF